MMPKAFLCTPFTEALLQALDFGYMVKPDGSYLIFPYVLIFFTPFKSLFC
jgi:hypothetical protein